ncbi:MAG: hypothetical protein A3H63_00435 [Candidatus Harrisonbacteria bacterium RIFCSPLOWO2_02_FULL_45_10c]|uniref:General secretion pathway GspH domain-containing protein n=1 Tax=Candidatus Harrisonbacteria bacterium RIFCSPLOWO2_02_FULL_45_10c TaxID=1798410 RepID=A0A1G1ZUQ6_9BACT|nr:MAG: hypothetical protein A3H63_00435 [Candidatus Harrisonbacteria bacterium RIFCSPLOWO2_02_FULL_45_10c]
MVRKAFTLIELLVVLGVTVGLSAVLITYSRTGERQIILFREQAKVINAILRAKNLAIQAYAGGGNVCGYGVNFQPNAAVIFKDLAPDCASSDNKYSGDASELFESYQLNPLVQFSQMPISDAVFIPPDLKVIFTPGGVSEPLFIISTLDGGSSVKIRINDAGQVTSE